jgi:hypothetical protein
VTPSPGADLSSLRTALAADDVVAMWTALHATASLRGLHSWRDIQVPARGTLVGLLWEAADYGASKCFIELTGALYEKSFWRGLGDKERTTRSCAFVLPLGSLHDKLIEEGAGQDQARDLLVDAFFAFFAKDADREQAINAFAHRLPTEVADARSKTRSQFEQAALEALHSEPVRGSARKGL